MPVIVVIKFPVPPALGTTSTEEIWTAWRPDFS
jgi:hypothetical protein